MGPSTEILTGEVQIDDGTKVTYRLYSTLRYELEFKVGMHQQLEQGWLSVHFPSGPEAGPQFVEFLKDSFIGGVEMMFGKYSSESISFHKEFTSRDIASQLAWNLLKLVNQNTGVRITSAI